ncbi:MAG: D-glutamate deacylase, partial [Gemmatimonadota bacterium]
MKRWAGCLVVVGLLLAVAPTGAQEVYDLVISGGRVMDPETGRDEIANVGITGDRIAAITTEPLRGRRVIDATGHIVAPGFIDILSGIAARRV